MADPKKLQELANDVVIFIALEAMKRNLKTSDALRVLLGAYFELANKVAKQIKETKGIEECNDFYDAVIKGILKVADTIRADLGKSGMLPQQRHRFEHSTASHPVPEPEVRIAMRERFIGKDGVFDMKAEAEAVGLETFTLGGELGVMVDKHTPTTTAAGEIKRASDIVTEALLTAIGNERPFVQVNGIPAGFFFYMNALAESMAKDFADDPTALPVRETIARGLRAYVEAFEKDQLVKRKD